jgi:hypothetical protein
VRIIQVILHHGPGFPQQEEAEKHAKKVVVVLRPMRELSRGFVTKSIIAVLAWLTALVSAFILFISPNSPVAPPGMLLVSTDLNCEWTLDGEPKEPLHPGMLARVRVALGKHLIRASTPDGQDTVELIAEVPAGQEIVQLGMNEVRQRRFAKGRREIQ